MGLHRTLIFPGAATCLAVAGVAQQQLFRVDAPPLGPSGGPFGDHLAIIGDKNGDGHDDMVTTVYVEPYPGATLRPMVWFLDGRTGQTLGHGRVWLTEMAGAGDVDLDGCADYAMSWAGSWAPQCAPYQCAGVEVRSGRSDAVLYAADMYPYPDMGRMLLGDVDLDGDERADLLAGTSTWVPYAGVGTGILYAFSSRGTLLYHVTCASGEAFAPGIGKFIDYDGDGCDDFLLGMYVSSTGAVDIRSGKTGAVLRRLYGVPPVLWGHGATAAMIGDQDGDGIADVVSGDSGPGTPGVIQVLGSVTGNLIHRWQVGTQGDDFGWPTVACLDVDRDGVDDLVANAPRGVLANWGQYVFSGRDGTLMKRYVATAQTGITGRLAAFPSQPGVLFDKYVTRGYQGSSVSMYFMSGGAPGVVQTGAAGQGTLSCPPRIGVRKLTPSGFRLTVSDAEPGLPTFLVLGFSQPPIAAIHLPSLGFPGCTLFPQPDLYGLQIVGSTGMAAGYAAHDFAQNLVATPGLGVYAVWAQWVTFGQTWAGGVSEAIRMYVQ